MKNIGSILIILGIILTGCVAIPAGYSPTNKSENEMIYKKHNEFKDISFYRHKAFFKFSPIEIYIGEGNDTYLRIKFKYIGSDWIFFESATIINSEGSKVKFSFNSYDREDDVLSNGSVLEYIDESLSDKKAKEILNLINTNNEIIKLRLSGKYYKDYVLNESQINGLKEILKKYFEM
jgi:hypothetical protein